MAGTLKNKNAEVYTVEDARRIAQEFHDAINSECYFLATVADKVGVYRELIYYLAERFKDDTIVINTIKKAKNKCESIVLHKTAKGEIPQALGIFVLKAYHGLIEVQRQEIKADVTTKTDHDFKLIEGE